jgi:metal-responsive CopG/Arc/MetJ family transcriptional regulator
MKVAISLPEPLYEATEKVAHQLGLNRSRFFQIAIEEYIKSHNDQAILDKINAVCKKVDTSLPKEVTAAQNLTIKKSTINDSW